MNRNLKEAYRSILVNKLSTLNEEEGPPLWFDRIRRYIDEVNHRWDLGLPRPNWRTWINSIDQGSQGGMGFVRFMRDLTTGQWVVRVRVNGEWRLIDNTGIAQSDINHIMENFPDTVRFWRRSDNQIVIEGKDGVRYWYQPQTGDLIPISKPRPDGSHASDPETMPLQNNENSDQIADPHFGVIPIPRRPRAPDPTPTLPERDPFDPGSTDLPPFHQGPYFRRPTMPGEPNWSPGPYGPDPGGQFGDPPSVFT